MNFVEYLLAQAKYGALGGGGGDSPGGGSGGTGGGSCDDVRYVTFMSEDGTVEYGKKAVAVGDDCADPIARGVFATPTRESDVQYNYTFYGWATEPNGGSVSNWNKAIMEDKTVYANFTKAVRYYTITYYDGDGTTVLKTESLAYGTMPNFTAEKEGYGFGGWIPELATVTGNASYTAVWLEKITFANASWADIARISESGEAADYFEIGDTKQFTYYGDTLTVAIAGFNHDDLADGTGKAGISIVCMNLPNYKTAWTSNYSSGQVYPYATSCTLRANLNGTMFNNLPEELRAAIKPVLKQSDKDFYIVDVEENIPAHVTISQEKLWALSLAELGYVTSYPRQYTPHGEKYALFNSFTKNDGFDVVHDIGTTGEKGSYWTRQGYRSSTASNMTRINYLSLFSNKTSKLYDWYDNGLKNAMYVRFGFCI